MGLVDAQGQQHEWHSGGYLSGVVGSVIDRDEFDEEMIMRYMAAQIILLFGNITVAVYLAVRSAVPVV